MPGGTGRRHAWSCNAFKSEARERMHEAKACVVRESGPALQRGPGLCCHSQRPRVVPARAAICPLQPALNPLSALPSPPNGNHDAPLARLSILISCGVSLAGVALVSSTGDAHAYNTQGSTSTFTIGVTFCHGASLYGPTMQKSHNAPILVRRCKKHSKAAITIGRCFYNKAFPRSTAQRGVAAPLNRRRRAWYDRSAMAVSSRDAQTPSVSQLHSACRQHDHIVVIYTHTRPLEAIGPSCAVRRTCLTMGKRPQLGSICLIFQFKREPQSTHAPLLLLLTTHPSPTIYRRT